MADATDMRDMALKLGSTAADREIEEEYDAIKRFHSPDTKSPTALVPMRDAPLCGRSSFAEDTGCCRVRRTRPRGCHSPCTGSARCASCRSSAVCTRGTLAIVQTHVRGGAQRTPPTCYGLWTTGRSPRIGPCRPTGGLEGPLQSHIWLDCLDSKL